MKQLFELPVVVKEARESHGKHVCIEILLFFAIMIMATSVEGILTIPFVMYISFKNPDFLRASVASDYAQVAEISKKLLDEPIIRIANLVSTAGLILVVILFCKFLQKRKITSMGFIKRNAVKEYAVGLGIGLGMFTIAILPCLLTGAVKLQSGLMNLSFGYLVAVFVGYLIQGMSEEVLCRGYFMMSICRRYPLVIGIMVNSISFAVLHLANNNISALAFINLILFGIFMSVYFMKRGSIWGVAAIHSMWNFAQGNIFGVKVSGLNSGDSVLNATSSTSLSILNGGEFGLEGGICTTIVLTVAILIVVYKVKQIEVYHEYTGE